MKAKKYLWSIICVYFCYLTHGIQAIILSQNNVNFAKQPSAIALIEDAYSEGVIPDTFLNCLEK